MGTRTSRMRSSETMTRRTPTPIKWSRTSPDDEDEDEYPTQTTLKTVTCSSRGTGTTKEDTPFWEAPYAKRLGGASCTNLTRPRVESTNFSYPTLVPNLVLSM